MSSKSKDNNNKLEQQISAAVQAAMAVHKTNHDQQVSTLQSSLQDALQQIDKLKISQSSTNQTQPTSGSINVNNDEVQFLAMSNHKFVNKDTSTKLELDRLAKIKSSKLSQIPKLKNLSSSESTNIEEIQTNYPEWKSGLLQYYKLVHPGFHKWLVKVASTLDIDEATEDPNYKWPALPSSLNMSTLDKIELKEATTSTILDYAHLVDNLEPTDT